MSLSEIVEQLFVLDGIKQPTIEQQSEKAFYLGLKLNELYAHKVTVQERKEYRKLVEKGQENSAYGRKLLDEIESIIGTGTLYSQELQLLSQLLKHDESNFVETGYHEGYLEDNQLFLYKIWQTENQDWDTFDIMVG